MGKKEDAQMSDAVKKILDESEAKEHELREELHKSFSEKIHLEAEQIEAIDLFASTTPVVNLSEQGEYPDFLEAMYAVNEYVELLENTVKSLSGLASLK